MKLNLLVILVFLSLLACDDIIDIYTGPYAPETEPVDISAYDKVILEGDSICAGMPSNILNNSENYAVPGSKTGNVIQRQNFYTVTDNDVFILWVGSNDFQNNTPVHDFIQHYEVIGQSYKNVIIISVLPRFTFNEYRNSQIDKLNYNLYVICERNGWKFVNVHNHYSQHSELFLDGVHLLNDSSYDYLMNQFIQ